MAWQIDKTRARGRPPYHQPASRPPARRLYHPIVSTPESGGCRRSCYYGASALACLGKKHSGLRGGGVVLQLGLPEKGGVASCERQVEEGLQQHIPAGHVQVRLLCIVVPDARACKALSVRQNCTIRAQGERVFLLQGHKGKASMPTDWTLSTAMKHHWPLEGSRPHKHAIGSFDLLPLGAKATLPHRGQSLKLISMSAPFQPCITTPAHPPLVLDAICERLATCR
eukprot:1161580-Pelagomonas_calceolata.AAC.10